MVVRPRTPSRSSPPGRRISNNTMMPMLAKIPMKKNAVGHVHAIQVNMSNPPHREALGDVVSHKVDYDRTRNDGQNTSSGQQAKLKTGA